MSNSDVMSCPSPGMEPRVDPRMFTLLLSVGLGLLILSWLAGNTGWGAPLLAAGVTLLSFSLLVWLLSGWQMRRHHRLLGQAVSALSAEVSPWLITDQGGRLLHAGLAARRLGAADGAEALLALFHALPADALQRLAVRAWKAGSVREQMPGPGGLHDVEVRRGAGDLLIWKVEARLASGPGIGVLDLDGAGGILGGDAMARRILGELPARLEDLVDSPMPGMFLVLPEGRFRLLFSPSPAAARQLCLVPEDAWPTPVRPSSFEDLPVSLLEIDAAGRIRSANARARRKLGLSRDLCLPGRPGMRAEMHELFEGLGRPISDWVADALAGRGGEMLETLRLRLSESERFVQIALRQLHGTRGGVLAVIWDATAMKNLEAQFVQSQKMQAIGQLAGGVAHDFNNLLTGISGYCDLLLLRHAPGDPDHADLAQIEQNANRAAALVAQLLAFSRKQTLTPQFLHPEEVINPLVELLQRLLGDRTRLSIELGEDLGYMRVDRRQMEQVLMNLVVNARDAMRDGGEVRLSARHVRLDMAMQRDRVEVPVGDYVVMQVVDGGIGIPADLLGKVFEPFFTTKRMGEGTGLGLSTAYGIVKQSGGYIFLDSREGEGSTCSIWLPRYAQAEEVPHAPRATVSPLAEPLLRHGVVLLAEDEVPVRAFMARALRLRGHEVIEADSGEAALEALHARQGGVDLIISDVIMSGLDGPGWVTQALTICPDVPVIFTSGYAEEGFADVLGEIPRAVFMPKPFSLNVLVARVAGLLEKAPVTG